MNIRPQEKIVVLGFLSHFPVAGVAWQTLHYLVGFQRLGYEVFYVEAHGCTPSKLMQTEHDDGAARAAAYIEQIMRRVGLEHSWAYHSLYDSRYFGLSGAQLRDLYQSAALLLNLHGSHLPAPELAGTGRLVYLETDPVDVQIDLFHQKTETIDYLSPHCAFFTFGENLGQADCLVPASEQFRFIPTRQPVVMDFWEQEAAPAECFTTVGNWRQPWRECTYKQEVYRWSKHLEFQKFLDLPSRTAQPLELALSSFSEEDRKVLESKGWRVRPALELSVDPDVYRQYIGQSRGEFTVAKDQNVRLRSGWFSDRAVTYLAAGRPVINQETGFSKHLPTGEGLFAFSTIEDAAGAIERINSSYERHRRAARNIAREFFSHDVVLPQLIRELGLSLPRQISSGSGVGLPPDMAVMPVSRWPTRLPESTLEIAMALPPPVPVRREAPCSTKASVILVTHNGLPYTKLCLASLCAAGWQPEDELVIVDNASTDGTRDYLLELSRRNPWIQIILNEVNRGFATANNQAVAKTKNELLIFLNPDTLVSAGWQCGLARWLQDVSVGMAGPVTNRTCNEAQIDAPYRTLAELEQFARDYTTRHSGEATAVAMLALFCAAIRRETFELVGPLDERFEFGMFEDDDYGRRLRQAGYKVLCAEDVFVHHFGQGSFGELCGANQYDQIFDANRRRFEEKWSVPWKPHLRRITPEYSQLRQRIHAASSEHLPAGTTIAVISKGDEELVNLHGHRGWHFPQSTDGSYANIYPADGSEAVAQLQAIRAKGARYLLIPQPAFWWLDYYREFKSHLESSCRLALRQDETCLIFDLRGNDD